MFIKIAAFEFLMDNLKGTININDFEKACGIGVEVTGEQIEEVVEEVIKRHRKDLLERRYQFNTGILMGEVGILKSFCNQILTKII